MEFLNKTNLTPHRQRIQTVARAMFEAAMDEDPAFRTQIEEIVSEKASEDKNRWILIDLVEQGLLAKAEEALKPAENGTRHGMSNRTI